MGGNGTPRMKDLIGILPLLESCPQNGQKTSTSVLSPFSFLLFLLLHHLLLPPTLSLSLLIMCAHILAHIIIYFPHRRHRWRHQFLTGYSGQEQDAGNKLILISDADMTDSKPGPFWADIPELQGIIQPAKSQCWKDPRSWSTPVRFQPWKY